MSINSDYQKLEPGNTVRLFEVDGTAFGVGDVLRFHAYNIPHTEAEIEATNPVSPIRLDDSTLDRRVTYTRAGAVSYIGQDGKIYQAAANQWPLEYLGGVGRTEPEPASTNLVKYSNDISNAIWTATRAIKTSGFAAPDGSNTACKIAPDTSNNTHQFSQPVAKVNSTTYVYSIYLKAAEHSKVQMQVGNYAQQTNGQAVRVDLSAGTATANDPNRCSIQYVGNGWYRVSSRITTNDVAGNITAQVWNTDQTSSFGTTFTGDGTSGVLCWGAQLEVASLTSSLVVTNASVITRSAATASVPANGASGIKITYSTGETTNLSFGSASSIQIPTATKAWGTRYITGIEYVGGVPTYDESKLPAKSIWWQGIEYAAWPCQIEGIESSTTGSSAQPKLTVANLDGSITALCLAYDDMLQAKVSIHDTLAKYLDVRNFPEGNTSADPTQEKLKVYYIDSKSVETKLQVEFTLSSPMDLQGLQIPTRQLHSLCTWCIRGKYRSGDGCDYAGTRYFDKFNKPVSDPSLDVCSGNLTGCKLRFGENNELSFGGFPGTSLLRT